MVWFDQENENPFIGGADGALFIGDVALRPRLYPDLRFRYDLGLEWWEHTALPFAFGLWQVSGGSLTALHALHRTLLESRAYWQTHRTKLSVRYASHFGLKADFLDSYWAGLSFELDDSMIEGLKLYYTLAARIGEIREVPELTWL
jgi:chorismate dehydratase